MERVHNLLEMVGSGTAQAAVAVVIQAFSCILHGLADKALKLHRIDIAYTIDTRQRV